MTGPGRYSSVAESESSFLFLSASQHYRQRMTLHVRSTLPPGETLGHMRRILVSIDPNIALRGPQRLTEAVGVTLFPQRFAAAMIGLFGLIGLIFATTGIYGVMSFHVAQRTREIGDRVDPSHRAGRNESRGGRRGGWLRCCGVDVAAPAEPGNRRPSPRPRDVWGRGDSPGRRGGLGELRSRPSGRSRRPGGGAAFGVMCIGVMCIGVIRIECHEAWPPTI